MPMKRAIRSALRLLGYDLQRIGTPPPNPLVYHKIDVLLDVGASAGHYALQTRKERYLGRIVSFEPLSSAHTALADAARGDLLWDVHARCAIGAEISEVTIQIAGNSQSSSLLPMLGAHSAAAPGSAYVGSEQTRVITLDSVFDVYRKSEERVFLKIDTQGYEKQVLDGAARCISDLNAIQIELSIVPLYEGQELYAYFFMRLQRAGFQLWSLIPTFSNEQTGQLLQFDAIFVRE